MTRVAIAALLAQALAGCEQPVPPPTSALVLDRTAVERGAQAFSDPATSAYAFNAYACSTCHDVASRGETIRAGVPLAGVVDRPSYWGGNEIDLLRAVDHCLELFMLEDQRWSGDEPIARDLYAYLESLAGAESDRKPAAYTFVVDIGDAPGGDARRGALVYDRTCRTCHGVAHSGASKLVDFAPVLPDEALSQHPLGKYTPLERRQVFLEKVRHGGFLGYGGQMPPFSREELADTDLGDLLAFFGM